MLFSTAAAEYMDDKKKRLRATTIDGYASAIRCHLMPHCGKREIESISFEEVQDWVDSFALPGAAEKAYKTFRQIYRWVLRRHQLRIWDVTQGVELPKKPSVRRQTLTAEQERTTLKAIVGQPFKAAVLLGAATVCVPSAVGIIACCPRPKAMITDARFLRPGTVTVPLKVITGLAKTRDTEC